MKIIILKYNPDQLANNVVEFLVPKVIYLWKSYTYRFLYLIKNILNYHLDILDINTHNHLFPFVLAQQQERYLTFDANEICVPVETLATRRVENRPTSQQGGLV